MRALPIAPALALSAVLSVFSPAAAGLPAISAPSPASGIVTVTAATDLRGVREIGILVDGVVLATCRTSPCAQPWDTTAVADGRHTLRARVLLTRDRVRWSTVLGVTVDNEAPPPPPGGPPTLAGCPVFPPDNPWNTDISAHPVHPNSAAFIASIGPGSLHPDWGSWAGELYGIPYVTVPGTQPLVPIEFVWYGDESDPGPYPVPPDAPVEGGSDRHVLVVDRDNCVLYELYAASRVGAGGPTEGWTAGSGAVWDLRDPGPWPYRPEGWTSADAAGLPILPGLVRHDEVVEKGEINHALRFTVARTQRGYIPPASHFASSSTDPNRPPMGLRLRLKASYDIATFHPQVQVILRALKRYGMIVADNGSSWFITGAADWRWDQAIMDQLKSVPGGAFEAIYTGEIRR